MIETSHASDARRLRAARSHTVNHNSPRGVPCWETLGCCHSLGADPLEFVVNFRTLWQQFTPLPALPSRIHGGDGSWWGSVLRCFLLPVGRREMRTQAGGTRAPAQDAGRCDTDLTDLARPSLCKASRCKAFRCTAFRCKASSGMRGIYRWSLCLDRGMIVAKSWVTPVYPSQP